MLTILHTESSTGWGGQENRTLHESIGLKTLGQRIVILCQPAGVLGEKAEAEGIEVRRCRMRKSYDIFAIKHILDLIKTENIDIINTHSGKDSLLAGIAGRLSGKKPLIVRTRHLALPITSRFTYRYLTHRIVTVSEYVRQYLIGEGLPAKQVTAVPTCVDLTRFDPLKAKDSLRRDLGVGRDTPIVGTVSILRWKKGHHILIDAIPLILKKVPDAVFVFAGNGPQKKNILNKIKSLGLENKVFMLGLRNDVPAILKSIDLFVLPTFQEALGTSFLEAMAMEKPVVGTDVGGVGEVIKNGLNGFLIEPGNPRAVAEAVTGLLKDREAAKQMGIEGRKMVERNFSIDKMCREMFDLYSSLAERKNR
ncbi:MAG TPA: glycosyltransferase family 1 protein [Nitrospirae bacterium]|nr:glycosyltransferase family 1 protein [Nitrospirota bacterium]